MVLIDSRIIQQVEQRKAHEAAMVEHGVKFDSTLAQQLGYLNAYGCHETDRDMYVVIGPDLPASPFSYSVSWYRKARSWERRVSIDQGYALGFPELAGYTMFMFGGLIYHGRHDNGGDGGPPTFSVNLQPVSGWSVHT